MHKFFKENNINNQSGQVMLALVVLFLLVSMVIVFGVVNPILKQTAISKAVMDTGQGLFLAESGLEDVVYRLKNNKQVSASETLSLNGANTTTLISDIVNGKEITSTASKNSNYRIMKSKVQLGVGASFFYGVQAGQGGFDLNNSSSIIGNVYSGGPITGSGNMIYGDVVSSGAAGLISGIHATGTAYAHTIQNSTIDKDAYYVAKINTTVSGTSHPNSPDQPDVGLPISDAQIASWEADAAAGGSVVCSGGNYTINTNTTIGPKKIPCNLVIGGNSVITLSGHIWVSGNITAQNSSIIKVAAALGNNSVVMIADNPLNRTTSSIVTFQNSNSFQNSGTAGSYVFVISMNTSGENGGTTEAISNSNASGGAVVLYAPHGLIELTNNINVKEITAYKIKLSNSAQVRYDTGLPSTIFTSGPGGGYDILEWEEVQ